MPSRFFSLSAQQPQLNRFSSAEAPEACPKAGFFTGGDPGLLPVLCTHLPAALFSDDP